MSTVLLLATGILMPAFCAGNVYDHLMPNYIADTSVCPHGCAQWASATSNATEQAEIDAMWAAGVPPAGAKNICAMPAASAGRDLGDGDYNDIIVNSFAGPWCYCKGVGPQYCKLNPKKANVPQQINLQLAKQDVVVVSFVTHEESSQGNFSKPIAEIQPVEGGAPVKRLPGISHFYGALAKAEHQDYTLHFIKLSGLESGKSYRYRVRSGSFLAPFSEWFTFRATSYAKQKPTRLAIYGDMGHSHHNPMENLGIDCQLQEIDFIVHMGDHAYDLGHANDKRGDAYMNVYQPTLATCPWLPIIGNHEANDGDNFNRYLNMTWGEVVGKDMSAIRSTADSALGELLTKATLFGTGIHSAVPSNTSRYFSIDVGLIHIVGLDLNRLDVQQLQWLEKDLAAVDRQATPWIIVSSHFPLYHATVSANMDKYSAAYYAGDEPEGWATSGHDFKTVDEACAAATNDEEPCDRRTIGDMQRQLTSLLNPILEYYKVDIYAAGHVHDYNSNWPICEGGICMDDSGVPQTNFNKPRGPVHICEGNGGVPGVVGESTLTNCSSEPWCRVHGTGGAYGRIVAQDAHSLTYSHVQNSDGIVTDEFTIKK